MDLFTILCDTDNTNTSGNIQLEELKSLFVVIEQHKTDIPSMFQIFCVIRYMLLQNTTMIAKIIEECNGFDLLSLYMSNEYIIIIYNVCIVILKKLNIGLYYISYVR